MPKFDDDRKNEFWLFIRAGDDESDRGHVLCAGAYLELCVERALRAFLVKVKPAERLLRADGPLGSHGARVDLSECLGIISMFEADALRLFARLRNTFAHQLDAKLDAGPINDRILAFAKLVCLEELDEEVASGITNKGPRALLTVSTFILADWLRDRDLLIAEMAEPTRIDFSEMHRSVQDILEEAE